MHPNWVSRSRSVYYCSIQSRMCVSPPVMCPFYMMLILIISSDVGVAIVSGFFCLFALIFEICPIVTLCTKWGASFTKIVLPHTQLAFYVKLIKRIAVLSVLFMVLNLYVYSLLKMEEADLADGLFRTALLEGIDPAMVLVPRFNFAICKSLLHLNPPPFNLSKPPFPTSS